MNLLVDSLSFGYGPTKILREITISAAGGEVVGLVGPNGAGKSTLLRCMLGILTPEVGRVLIDGQDMRSLNPSDRAKVFSYVPQTLSTMFPAPVFDTVMLGRKPHLYWKPREDDERIVAMALTRLELESLAFRDVTTLSGGERQRALVARAFAQEARVMLLDEPTASLDIRHQIRVLADVGREIREREMVGLIAIHDLNLAARFCDRLVLLKDGVIFADGAPNEVVTAQNVMAAYGADVHVISCEQLPVIVPMRPSVTV